jgi:enoyl-CoA hydratase/carnithine racemase
MGCHEERAMTTAPILLRDDADGVTTLTLNRPDQRNGLSSGLMAAISDALAAIREDRTVRVVVIAGAGPAFCAGHDLKELRGLAERASLERVFAQCSAMMQAIVALPQPVIAKVHGIATAAGCQLVATCDLAVASEDARFATPGVNIGLFCSTPMVALSRNVGRKQAMEMLLTGEPIDAATAAAWGLINRAVPAARLDAEVDALARRIAAKSTLTVAIGKEAFYAQAEEPLAAAYARASAAMTLNMLAADAQEGICAFLDKRAPVWRDS